MLSSVFTEMTQGSEGPKILSTTVILTVLCNNRSHLYIKYRKIILSPKDCRFKIILIYYELLQTFKKDMKLI